MVTNADAYEIRVWYTPDKGDEGFLAVVAEMPGVSAWGSTREEALREIQVALRLVLSTYDADNEAPPPPLYGRANSLNYPWEQGQNDGETSVAKKRVSAPKKAVIRKPKTVKKSSGPSRAIASSRNSKKKTTATSAVLPSRLARSSSSARVRVEDSDRLAA